MAAFCRWYEKDMEQLTEHEQEQCAENGQDCCDCPDLSVDEKNRMTLQEFAAMGGCVGCEFHQNVEIEFERKECTFPWFDESAEEWGHEKNCDKMEEWLKVDSGFDVFETPIRRSIIAEKSTTAMMPLPKFSKNCIVSQDYRCVVHEILKEMEG